MTNRLYILTLLLLTAGCTDRPKDGASSSQEEYAHIPVHAATTTYITKNMRITAYCPCSKCCGKWADGITANGHHIRPGDAFVAAPPDMPFGTLVSIPGYAGGRKVPVLDRGGSIKGNRLDVFYPTHQEALNFGIQYLTIVIYNK